MRSFPLFGVLVLLVLVVGPAHRGHKQRPAAASRPDVVRLVAGATPPCPSNVSSPSAACSPGD